MEEQFNRLENLVIAAGHALRSYQFGNSSPDLAEEIADEIDAARLDARPIKISWEWQAENLTWFTRVPASDHVGDGFLNIHAIKRPGYCDRGKWHVLVEPDGVAGPDEQEGFPRYYFSLANLQDEMEAWVNERDKCVRAFKKP